MTTTSDPGNRGPIQRLFAILFWEEPVEFECRRPLNEAVAALADKTSPRRWFGRHRHDLVGHVGADRVSLWRPLPAERAAFGPYFEGAFVVRGETIVLSGRFTLMPEGKAALASLLGADVLAFFAALAAAPSQPKALLIALASVAALAAGTYAIDFHRRAFRRDRDYIGAVIRQALGTGPAPDQFLEPATMGPRWWTDSSIIPPPPSHGRRDTKELVLEPGGGLKGLPIGSPKGSVRAFLGQGHRPFKRAPDSNPSDLWPSGGIFAYYDSGERLEALEFAGPRNPTLNGLVLNAMSMGEAVGVLKSLDPELLVEPDGATSTQLGVGIWASMKEPDQPVMSVITFGPGYYDKVAPLSR